jgi:iron complex outermembrane receptor protein
MKKFSFWLLLQLSVLLAAGQVKLSGVVIGDGEPLVGASVVLEKSLYGISTGSDGSFEFKNLKTGNYKVKVSFIGFVAKTVAVRLTSDQKITVELEPDVVLTDEILVSATRAGSKTPMAYNNVSGEEIARRNMGQDIPYLLQLTPSFVATSDAGAGVGYTSFRIRGTDMNRINVTVNGIPANDAESHGTWFVDLPDLASSVENVQVQRGVGTSTNGAAAFGATINMQTNALRKDAYGEYKTAFGTFNTFKNTVSAGTGLLNGKFAVDARLSKVSSDGYIDRATSDLKSFFVSGGYYSENTVIKVNVFSGFEETYQAWNGISSEMLGTNRTYNSCGEYTDENGVTQFYDNQVDHYQQDNYQLHFSHKLNELWNINASAHYTYGRGYYENYKEDKKLADYQLPDIVTGGDTIRRTDLVNRKWLDNNFYGATYSVNYNNNKSAFTLGGAFSNYDGDHFGNVIWAQYYGSSNPNHEWYRNKGKKKDYNFYVKYNYLVGEKLNLFADLQFRKIDYSITGIDDDLRDLGQSHDYNFFNPKFGVSYQMASNQKLYVSFAIANREPNRTAIVDAPNGNAPEHETLQDLEAGYNFSSSRFSFAANYYFMNYKNQLVLTGEINDVAAPIMVNVGNSFRTGIELQAGVQIVKTLQWNGNATFSSNKIKDFTEYVDNWDTWGQEQYSLGTTDIAFSPNVVANSQLVFTPVKNFDIRFVSSFVGKQYIDNTSNNDRSLNSYFVNHIKADYNFKTKLFNEITLHLMVNNIFNEVYESNAWVYSYIYNGQRSKMDGYYPQAGTHFMFGVDFRF